MIIYKIVLKLIYKESNRNNNKLNFAKATIKKLPILKLLLSYKLKNYTTYYTNPKSLCVIVFYEETKTFYLRYKILGRSYKIALSRFFDITIEQARRIASKNCNMIHQGKDPNKEKKKLRQDIILKELFALFVKKHAIKNNKPKTI